MIEIKDKSNCCGCSACVQRCPKQCVSLMEDEEGFLYPHVDTGTCIDCGLCEKVCPIINQAESKKPLNTYAAKNKNLQERELSSSGGLFISLAEKTIESGGVVFGVVFDENWEAHHVAATTIDELQPMMRSKYIQSRTENTFAEAEKYLKDGRDVMYTGTSCQISALKLFLRKDYDNLLAVDIICHGVPSPGVWRSYLREVVKEPTICATGSENIESNHPIKYLPTISDLSFREKGRSGYNWQSFGFVLWEKASDNAGQKKVLTSCRFNESPFFKGFHANIYLRPSCYSCPAKGGTSRADITIADFWGIDNVFPDFSDASGVGLAVIHTDKGEAAFQKCSFEVRECSIRMATDNNPSYWHPVKKPRCREIFFHYFAKKKQIAYLVEHCTNARLIQRIQRKLEKFVIRIFNL